MNTTKYTSKSYRTLPYQKFKIKHRRYKEDIKILEKNRNKHFKSFS